MLHQTFKHLHNYFICKLENSWIFEFNLQSNPQYLSNCVSIENVLDLFWCSWLAKLTIQKIWPDIFLIFPKKFDFKISDFTRKVLRDNTFCCCDWAYHWDANVCKTDENQGHKVLNKTESKHVPAKNRKKMLSNLSNACRIFFCLVQLSLSYVRSKI